MALVLQGTEPIKSFENEKKKNASNIYKFQVLLVSQFAKRHVGAFFSLFLSFCGILFGSFVVIVFIPSSFFFLPNVVLFSYRRYIAFARVSQPLVYLLLEISFIAPAAVGWCCCYLLFSDVMMIVCSSFIFCDFVIAILQFCFFFHIPIALLIRTKQNKASIIIIIHWTIYFNGKIKKKKKNFFISFRFMFCFAYRDFLRWDIFLRLHLWASFSLSLLHALYVCCMPYL